MFTIFLCSLLSLLFLKPVADLILSFQKLSFKPHLNVFFISSQLKPSCSSILQNATIHFLNRSVPSRGVSTFSAISFISLQNHSVKTRASFSMSPPLYLLGKTSEPSDSELVFSSLLCFSLLSFPLLCSFSSRLSFFRGDFSGFRGRSVSLLL